MIYEKINKELDTVFGAGKIKIRPAPTKFWSYILEFKSTPTDEEISLAQSIVDKYEPTLFGETMTPEDETPETETEEPDVHSDDWGNDANDES